MKKILTLTFVLVFLAAGLSFAAEVPYKTGVAIKAVDEIVLDGFSDEWEAVIKWRAEAMSTVEALDVLPQSVLWMQWDEANLYFFVRVMDPVLSAANPLYFWECDVVELFLDGENAKTELYNINTGQFWATPVGGGEDGSEPTIGRWGQAGGDPLVVAGIQHPDLWNLPALTGTVPGMEVAVNVDDIGYTMEIKIAASAIGLEGLEAGDVIGFNYMVTDINAVGSTFWATSKADDTKSQEHPSLWGEVTLIE